MNMQVHDGLAGGGAYVDADVVGVWLFVLLMSFARRRRAYCGFWTFDFGPWTYELVYQFKDSYLFLFGGVEPVCDVAAGDEEHVAGADGEVVANGQGEVV